MIWVLTVEEIEDSRRTKVYKYEFDTWIGLIRQLEAMDGLSHSYEIYREDHR